MVKLMKYKFLVVFVLILVSGCVTSLNPIQEESQRIKDPSLAGVYVGPEKEVFIIMPPDESALYKVIITDDGDAASIFEVALTKIEDKHYLDFYPLSCPGQKGFLALHFSAWHTFFQVDLKSDGIESRTVDSQWLDSYTDENPSALLTHGLKILAPTDELRGFIAKHNGLFKSEPRLYKRQSLIE